MKRYLIYYNNGLLEHACKTGRDYERLINNGIVQFVVDTVLDTVMRLDAQGRVSHFHIADADDFDPEVKDSPYAHSH